MSMVTLFLLCATSCWCCEDWEYRHLLQRNEQLQRDNAALRLKLEVLQTEAVRRGLQETHLECCPCNRSGVPNVTVLSHYENGFNSTEPLQGSSWQVTSGTTTNAYRQLASGTTTSGTTTNPYWHVEEGDCVLDEDDCLTVVGIGQLCQVRTGDAFDGWLTLHDFPSASTSAQIFVNGVYYQSNTPEYDVWWDIETPATLDGVVPYPRFFNQYFTGLDATENTSIKVCRSNTTYEWTYWTCTVLGDDCTRSDNNPDRPCSMWYSDSRERGHPWCMAPTADGSEQAQVCGPCSCLPGEEQTYNSRVLADNWFAYEYIVCTPCVPGTFKSIGGFGADDLCSPCSAGQHTSTHGATACDLCEAGQIAALRGSSRCAECGAGQFTTEKGAWGCERCAAGRFGTSAGSSLCLCDAGHYRTDDNSSVCEACSAGHWSKADASACEACDPGHFAPGEGSSSCLPCIAGQFSATNNSTMCEDCAIGRFADDSGMEQCDGCYDVLSPGGANPRLWTTMREELWNDELVLLPVAGADKLDDSGCDAGAWMSLDSQCYECGEGVLCKGLGEVIVMEGYFAPSHDAGDVWKCHGIAKRCPGGSPGTCARNRVNTSLACGECTLGTRATTSGACEECGSGQPWLLALAALFLLVGLCVVYFLIAKEDRAKQKNSVALIAIIASQVVTAM